VPLPRQLDEMVGKLTPRRSEARKNRRAVGRAAPRRKLTAWLLCC
jgi:hypothetical protein